MANPKTGQLREHEGVSRWLMVIAVITITLAGVIAFGNAIQGDWALDDFPRIVENEHIRMDQFSISRLWEASSSPPERERWVTNATFALNYYMNGLEPWGYRFVNLGVHLGTALGLFLFLVLVIRQLNRNEAVEERGNGGEGTETGAELERTSLLVAWVAVLIWCVHPVLTQAVNYTAQRGVILSGLFYVWGLWGFLEWRRRASDERVAFLIFSILMGLLSVKSKEIGGTFVVAIGLLYWLEPDENKGEGMNRWLIGGGLILLFGLISLYLLGGLDGVFDRFAGILANEPQGNKRFTPLERVMTEWRVVVFYLSLVVYPGLNRLNLEHDMQLSTGLFSPPSTALALLLIIVLLVAAYKIRRREPIVAFGVFWFFLQLVVTSTVLNLELVFEHRVYLATVGPILIFVHLLFRSVSVSNVVRAGLIFVLVGVLSWTTHERNEVWANTLTLYQDAVKKAPDKPRNLGNLGVAHAKKARRLVQSGQQYQTAYYHMVKALIHHRSALEKSKNQDRPIPTVFTGNIDNLLKELTEIWRHIDERRSNVEWTKQVVTLHRAFLSRYPRHVQDHRELKQQLTELRIYLAEVYQRNGRTDRAEQELMSVIRESPERRQQMLETIEDPKLKQSIRKRIERLREGE